MSYKARSRLRGSIPKRAAFLFVYGTLRRRGRNKFARLLHANADFIGTAALQAQLGRTRPHLGAVLSDRPGDQIAGEVFQLRDPSKLFPILDEYEGPQYKRTPVQVRLDSGERLQAWVYLYKG